MLAKRWEATQGKARGTKGEATKAWANETFGCHRREDYRSQKKQRKGRMADEFTKKKRRLKRTS